jgi:uncharacterized protein
MNILITGSSGLIGTALKESLISMGHTVFPMQRSESCIEPFYWQPSENIIKFDESIQIDTVIHLAGANIAGGRWNDKRKKIILDSRVIGTNLLVNALAKLQNKPKVLISGSAIGFYGDTGDGWVDESSNPGTGFLSNVCQRWEKATEPASEAGIRTVHMRIGVVLSLLGGALKKMLLPFKLGLGGIVGNGSQYMSWVSIDDITSMIQFIIENETINGAVNLVSKNPITNKAFTKTLGSVLSRPTVFPLPAFAARMVFGEMADSLLLSSTRVFPKKLSEAGYKYINDDLEKTIKSLLSK